MLPASLKVMMVAETFTTVAREHMSGDQCRQTEVDRFASESNSKTRAAVTSLLEIR
jgi:hypothetical protein